MTTNVGRWAVNGAGQLGKIERIENGIHKGSDMNGSNTWASMAPMVLDAAASALVDEAVNA